MFRQQSRERRFSTADWTFHDDIAVFHRARFPKCVVSIEFSFRLVARMA
jgi:hypothetical protein